jgi:dihydrofolate synthase / folylpolyglutamate synthase
MSRLDPASAAAEALLAPRIEHRIVPGLDRIRNALAVLGHPERSAPAVLVVGTNGKGSTAALLASMLSASGLRVGLYTSPHLVRVNERIQVSDQPITDDRLLALLHELARFPELSYFETLTAAAHVAFAESGVDIAVLEAGMGGRWDATAAGEPSVSLLTNVGTDHAAWLGATRNAIAAEKGAALRGRAAIVGSWDDEVEGAIRAAADPSTPLSLASHWASVTENAGTDSTARAEDARPRALGATAVDFSAAGACGSASLPLAGRHQVANLALALAGAAALAKHGLIPPLAGDRLARGIGATRWPGRLQWLAWNGRRLLLDGGHNREAIAALAATLDASELSRQLDLLFSCLDDKPLAAMAALLAPRVRTVTVAPVASPRAMPLSSLAAAFPGCRTAPDAASALAELPSTRPTLVAGSLRLVGEVLRDIEGGRG